jgi:hypothetical protein
LKALQDLTEPVPSVVPSVEQPPHEDMNPGAHVIPDDEYDDIFDPNVGRNDEFPPAQDVNQSVIEIGRNNVVEQGTGRSNEVPATTNPVSTRMRTRSKPSNEIIRNDVEEQATREVERLHTYYNPTDTLIDRDEEEIQTEIVNLVLHTLHSDPGEPKNLEEAFNGLDKAKWFSSVKDGVQNFLDRDEWEEVLPLHKVVKEGRKPFRTKTAFKIKEEQDGSKRYKS